MNFLQSQYGYPSGLQQPFSIPLPSNLFPQSFTLNRNPEQALNHQLQALQKVQGNQFSEAPCYNLNSNPSKKIKHTQHTYTQSLPTSNYSLQAAQKLIHPNYQIASQNLLIPTPKKQTLFQSPQALELLKYQQMAQANSNFIQQYLAMEQLFQQYGYNQSDSIYQQNMSKLLQQQSGSGMLKKDQNEIEDQQKLLFVKKPTYSRSGSRESCALSLSDSTSAEKDQRSEADEEWSKDLEKPRIESGLIKLEDWENTSGNNSEIPNLVNVSVEKANRKSQEKPKIQKIVRKPRQTKSAKRNEQSDFSQNSIKDKSEVRRKNKWQLQAEQSQDPINSQATQAQTKIHEAQRQDDTNTDYEYLQSITITNDPAKIGQNNSTNGFVVLTRDNQLPSTTSEVPKETPVGSRYQTAIPELNSRPREQRKIPELVWNPEMTYSSQLEDYFDGLKKTLKCEYINHEKALKLLKRKNYQSEKVLVNISKNEKFYSSFLVITDVSKDTVAGDAVQQGSTM